MDINKLGPKDHKQFQVLISIFHDVFEHAWGFPDPTYLQRLLTDTNFKVFVVSVEGQVVGGLTVYFLQQYYQPGELAFVYDVGVSKPYQGRGLGKALMTSAKEYCRARGCSEMFVDAESEDTDAIGFYRKTAPGTEMQVTQFSYWLRHNSNDFPGL